MTVYFGGSEQPLALNAEDGKELAKRMGATTYRRIMIGFWTGFLLAITFGLLVISSAIR